MKNINIKSYLMWLTLFASSIIVFNLVQWQHNFAFIFIWVVMAIWLINTGWIFFYKTLNTKDEIQKYVFSFINIVLLIAIIFPFI